MATQPASRVASLVAPHPSRTSGILLLATVCMVLSSAPGRTQMGLFVSVNIEKTIICAGATDTPTAKSRVILQVTGPNPGGRVISLSTSGGRNLVGPSLSSTTPVSDASGAAEVWLRSGDLAEIVTVSATIQGGVGSSDTVTQAAPALDISFTHPDTGAPITEMTADGQSEADLTGLAVVTGVGAAEGHGLSLRFRMWELGTDPATEPPDFEGTTSTLHGTLNPTAGVTDANGWQVPKSRYVVGLAPGEIDFIVTDNNVFVRNGQGVPVAVERAKRMSVHVITITVTPDTADLLTRPPGAFWDIWDRILIRTTELDNRNRPLPGFTLTCSVPDSYSLSLTNDRVPNQFRVNVRTRTDGYAQVFFFSNNVNDQRATITVEYEWKAAMGNKPAKTQVVTTEVHVIISTADVGSNDPHWWNGRWPGANPITLTWSGDPMAIEHQDEVQQAIDS